MKKNKSAPENRIVIYLTDENCTWLRLRLARWSQKGLLDLSLAEIAQGCITLCRQKDL